MSDPPSKIAAFLSELKRRRVFRVAAVYAGVAFIIGEIVDITFDPLGIPAGFDTAVIVLLILGFPVAVALAWAFDITDKGIVRTKGKAHTSATSRRPILTNWTLGIVAALAIIVAAWSWLREPSPGGAPITSIAVLPLDNLGGDPEQVYFVDGMHEALITELAKLGALRVISRTSTLGFSEAGTPIPEIARALGVDAIVEGSVLMVGERVRINAQLIDGRREQHLWADDYEGDLTDILFLQKTVAGAIAREIGLALTPEEEAYLASAPQVNPKAYNLYLKGWHFRTLESEESMPKAVEYLEQAVALDPDYALAWAALGHSYLQMIWWGDWNGDYALNRMKPALDKALELDPNLPEAHVGLGLYQSLALNDIAGAEASFLRALELAPDNVYTRFEYGQFLLSTVRPDEALAEQRRAHELDPLSPQPLHGIGQVYFTTRQYDKALEYFQAILEISPGHNAANVFITKVNQLILMQQGRYAEVAAEAEKDSEFFDVWDFFRQLRVEWALGNREKVYAVRDSLRSTGELQQWEREDPNLAAVFYTIMGEKELALSLLERAYEDSTIGRTGLVYNPEFDFLRAEPRFKALLKEIGLTEVFDQYGQRIR